MAHVISEISPVKALMLTTRWKSDAENLNALGYTPKDSTYTIVQKSSAAGALQEMQRLANMLSLLTKTEEGLTPSHASYDQLHGLKTLCALSTSQNEGTAIAFYKDATEADEQALEWLPRREHDRVDGDEGQLDQVGSACEERLDDLEVGAT